MTMFGPLGRVLRWSIPPIFILLAACGASMRDRILADVVKSNRQECERPEGICHPQGLALLSLESLRAKGSELKIECDLEFIDYTEQSAREACLINVTTAVGSLMARWPDQLLPVSPEQITFELEDRGCISLMNGYCACPYAGNARVPLQWTQSFD